MKNEHSSPEDTIKRATAFVMTKEAQYVKDKTTQEAILRDSGDVEIEAEARKIRKEIARESDRLFSPDQADEEEVIIYNWIHKKKKK